MKLRDTTVTNVMADLGVETTPIGAELWAQCPQHEVRTGKPDHKPSWSINTETGAHFCFSCGYKGGLATLVRDLRGEKAASEFEAQIEQSGRTADVNTSAIKQKALGWKTRKPRERGIHEIELYAFSDIIPPEALEQRNITQDDCVEYGVLWDEKDESWILPFRLPTGELLGWQRKSSTGRFFHNEPKTMEKSRTVFGYHVAEEYEAIVVVESPLDAVRLFGLRYPAVAIAGSVVSESQVRLLSGFRRVIFALDNDEAGHKEMKRVRKILPQTLFPEYPGPYKDVGEMPKFLVNRMFRKYFL